MPLIRSVGKAEKKEKRPVGSGDEDKSRRTFETRQDGRDEALVDQRNAPADGGGATQIDRRGQHPGEQGVCVRMVVVAAGLSRLMIGRVMGRVIMGVVTDMRAMPRPFAKEVA